MKETNLINTENIEFKQGLHVIKMNPMLKKFYPDYSDSLKIFLEKQILRYDMEIGKPHIKNSKRVKIYIEFNEDTNDILNKSFKEIHNFIIGKYPERYKELIGGKSFYNNTFSFILYEYQTTTGITLDITNAAPELYLATVVTESFTVNYNQAKPNDITVEIIFDGIIAPVKRDQLTLIEDHININCKNWF